MQLDVIYNEECLRLLRTMPDECLDCVVTSPPYYGLRDYCHEEQIGIEPTPEQYVERLVDVFREVKRCLKPTGTLWLNLGDSYCGSGSKNANQQDPKAKKGRIIQTNSITAKVSNCKKKDLIGIPWMVAFALRADGWYLRQDIIWNKPNAMPESVKDRCTKSHEYIFLLTKSPNYYFDYEAIQEEATGYDGRKDIMMHGGKKYDNDDYLVDGKRNSMASQGHQRWRFKNLQEKGQQPNTMHLRRAEGLGDMVYPVRNKRDVWTISTKPSPEAHYAMYPEELVRCCVLAGCPVGGVVLDLFLGSGTTAIVARKLDRHFVGIELNKEFYDIAQRRVSEIIGFI